MQERVNNAVVLEPVARRRERIVIAAASVLAVATIGWFASWRSGMPPRAVLRGEGDTWPLAFTPDGKTFASSGTTGVTLWDTTTGRARAVWTHSASDYTPMGAFSPDGRTFAAINLHGPGSTLSIDLRDADDGRVRWSLPTRGQGVYAILFMDDGRRVRAVVKVGGSKADEVVDVDAVSGQERARRPFSVPGGGCSAVSPDGRLAARGVSSSITVWNVETNSEHAGLRLPASGPTVSSVAFSPDGSTLGVGMSGGTIELRDLATLKLYATLPGHRSGMRSAGLAFSPDGKTMASRGLRSSSGSLVQELLRLVRTTIRPGPDHTSEVVVMDVATGKRLGWIDSAIHPFFSADGRTLAVRDTSLAIKLFDVPTAAAAGKSQRGQHQNEHHSIP
jgi:WD40 repeat protein